VSDPITPATVLAFLDNRAGYEALRYLAAEPRTRVVGVVTHPEATALHGQEIRDFCDARGIARCDITEARAAFDARIAPLAPDYLVSIYFDYILDQRFLALPRREALNLHPGYLPYNKGFFYYVWAQIDGTPAGVSIHRMAASVDAGDVISQSRVLIDPADTGDVVYRKHEDEAVRLFCATWPAVLDGRFLVQRQRHAGTRHKISEARALTRLDASEQLSAGELIDRLRICTFADASGCTIELGGKVYRIALRLEELPAGEPNLLPGFEIAPAPAPRLTSTPNQNLEGE
jgi:methionyl-tRNA formyltransferase